MLERVSLQNQFYNIFAYGAIKGSTWSLVCCVTIRPLIIGGIVARRNDILVDLLLRGK